MYKSKIMLSSSDTTKESAKWAMLKAKWRSAKCAPPMPKVLSLLIWLHLISLAQKADLNQLASISCYHQLVKADEFQKKNKTKLHKHTQKTTDEVHTIRSI